MISVLRFEEFNKLLNSSQAHFLPFDLEKDKWEYTEDISKAQVIPMIKTYTQEGIDAQLDVFRHQYNGQLLLVLDLFHIDDSNDYTKYLNDYCRQFFKLTEHVVMVHTNKKRNSHIYYDMLWNRQKAYCTEYEKFDLCGRTWTWGADKDMYVLSPIKKEKNCKKFLSPNRIYYSALNHPRMVARQRLAGLLQNQEGYVSDPQKGLVLEPEQIGFMGTLEQGDGGTWWPVANKYYNSSYVSIYTETLTDSRDITSVTEKTWDPLIKGHFILPFGYRGLIEDIKSYGFILPDWLDYSYDSLYHFEERWTAYANSVRKFLNLSIKELDDYFQRDKHILEHNRQVFFTRPYDSLYDKIAEIIQPHN